jgi:hypothetical protein
LLAGAGADARPENFVIDAVPDRGDHTRTIAIRNDAREFHATIHASGASVCIRRINRRRMEPHADFAECRLRRWQIAECQYLLRTPLFLIPHRLHW